MHAQGRPALPRNTLDTQDAAADFATPHPPLILRNLNPSIPSQRSVPHLNVRSMIMARGTISSSSTDTGCSAAPFTNSTITLWPVAVAGAVAGLSTLTDLLTCRSEGLRAPCTHAWATPQL